MRLHWRRRRHPMLVRGKTLMGSFRPHQHRRLPSSPRQPWVHHAGGSCRHQSRYRLNPSHAHQACCSCRRQYLRGWLMLRKNRRKNPATALAQRHQRQHQRRLPPARSQPQAQRMWRHARRIPRTSRSAAQTTTCQDTLPAAWQVQARMCIPGGTPGTLLAMSRKLRSEHLHEAFRTPPFLKR